MPSFQNNAYFCRLSSKSKTESIFMENKTIKALFVNGGPRKKNNTAQMLESAMKGALDAGAEVEMVHLYDLDFKGCKRCLKQGIRLQWYAELARTKSS